MAAVAPAPSALRLVKECDLFRKLPPEHRDREGEAPVSAPAVVLQVISLVVIAYLSVSECRAYFSPPRKQRFDIDMQGGFSAGTPRQLRVKLDVTIHDFPCIDLSLDYQDVMGNRATDVRTTVYKQRLRADGTLVGEASNNDPKTATKGGASNPSIVKNGTKNTTCGECYGALPEGECCNTCSDVLYAYRLKRWALPRIESIEQCRHDGTAKSAYQPPQIIHLRDYSSDDYLDNFKKIGSMTKSNSNEARVTAPLGKLNLSLSLQNITFKPLNLKPLRFNDDFDDDYDYLDDDYDDGFDDLFYLPRRKKKDSNQTLKWPSCVRRNLVINGYDIGEALMEDLTIHGAKEGCFQDNCSKTDKFDCESMHHCATICGQVKSCQWWSWGIEEFAAKCWLRTGRHSKNKRYGFSSGSRNCTPAAKATESSTPAPVAVAAKSPSPAEEDATQPRRLMGLDDEIISSRSFELPYGSAFHMPMFDWRDSEESRKRKEQKGESCRIHGYFDVNRVPGNFHIGTHGAATPSYLSFYDEPAPPQQNMWHTINSLAFMDIASNQLLNNTQPLDGFESPKAFTFQYYLTISPATKRRDDGTALDGYQFRSASFVTNELIGPAVFFRMDMDPIRVTYFREEVRFSKFIVSICAVVGGCIAICSMLAQIFETAVATVQDKD
eukprot:TRINITY_DN39102_c0_g1_i1.p1 TRINITY_DN39102_c0_g1~~TRINITY_DN39102_c0_g1_i1.p1  ORF type:complete len:673 (-),score=128.63 TRINITY_DN39102_c0_g1_i1:45-2042(-)